MENLKSYFAVPPTDILLITGVENKARLRFKNLNWERLTDWQCG
jgi:hypothetical protein